MKPAEAVRTCSLDVPQSKAQHIVAEFVSISLIVQFIIREAIRNNQELVSMRGSLSEVGGARDQMEVTSNLKPLP